MGALTRTAPPSESSAVEAPSGCSLKSNAPSSLLLSHLRAA